MSELNKLINEVLDKIHKIDNDEIRNLSVIVTNDCTLIQIIYDRYDIGIVSYVLNDGSKLMITKLNGNNDKLVINRSVDPVKFDLIFNKFNNLYRSNEYESRVAFL